MSYSTKAKSNSQHPLERAALKHPSNPALRIGDSLLTYSELFTHSRQLSFGLASRGLQPGQIVALGDNTTKELIISIWACMLGGFVAFPINVRYPTEKIVDILSELNPALTISNTDYQDHSTLKFSELNMATIDLVSTDLPHFEISAAASLLMTSGSSGGGKYVQHTHHNHIESARGSNRNIPLVSSDSWLMSLPLYHIGGLSILFRTVLADATLVIPESKDSTLDEIESFGVSHISLVATQLRRLLDSDSGPRILSGTKAILLGGSAIPHGLIKESLDYSLPIHVSYGSTEMASQITTTPADNRAAALLNSGKVLQGSDLIISHEGEILVKGETLALGYLQNSILIDIRDEEGWFHTGDVGYTNVQGELTVTGRMDNQFISGGENVQPEHIERVLCRIPGVLSATVVALADEEFGVRPVAFLEVDLIAPVSEEITQQLRGHLPGYMLPIAYYEVPDELKLDSLKISRYELAKFISHGNKHLQTL